MNTYCHHSDKPGDDDRKISPGYFNGAGFNAFVALAHGNECQGDDEA
jgi:hypothetical protein